MVMPKLINGWRARSLRISSATTRASAFESPPPPYSFGQVGQTQPFAAMRSSQSFSSGFL